MTEKNPGMWSFFREGKGARKYHSTCTECDRDCKQSFRIIDLYCPYQEMLKKEKMKERRKKVIR